MVDAANLLLIVQSRLLVCHFTDWLHVVLDFGIKGLLLPLAVHGSSSLLPLALQYFLLFFEELTLEHLLELLLISLLGLLDFNESHFIHLIVICRVPLAKLVVAH